MLYSIILEYEKLFPISDELTHKEDKADWVYLLYNPINNLFKVGITGNLYERVDSIKSISGIEEIEMIFAIQLENGYDESAKVLEKFIHTYFESQRVKGEWFLLSKRNLFELRLLARKVHGWNYIANEKYKHIRVF